MLSTLVTALAAQALAGASPPPASPAEPPRFSRSQVFIAPSGQPFRAATDAPYPVVDWFAGADADHDGKLTESEFTADFLRYFASLDLDHDGTVDSTELEHYEDTVPELHTGFGSARFEPGTDQDGNPRARALGSYMDANSPQGAGRFDLLGIPEPVASMDTTLKGRINRSQAQDSAEYRFSLLDTQHHGYLVLADLPRTFAQKNSGGVRLKGGHAGHGPGHGGGGPGGPGGMGGASAMSGGGAPGY